MEVAATAALVITDLKEIREGRVVVLVENQKVLYIFQDAGEPLYKAWRSKTLVSLCNYALQSGRSLW